MGINPPIQQKLIAPADLAGAAALADGLHNVIQTPQFQQVMNQAIWSFFGQVFEPDVMEALRRFVMKAHNNDSRSYAVGTTAGPSAADAGRVKLLERDEDRVEAIIFNNGTATIYVGGRQVTVGGNNDANGGIPVAPNTGLVLDRSVGEIWAISGTANQDVRVLDEGAGVIRPR